MDKEEKKQLISRGLAALGSLAGYYIAKEKGEERMPYTVLGGLAGAFFATLIT